MDMNDVTLPDKSDCWEHHKRQDLNKKTIDLTTVDGSLSLLPEVLILKSFLHCAEPHRTQHAILQVGANQQELPVREYFLCHFCLELLTVYCLSKRFDLWRG